MFTVNIFPENNRENQRADQARASEEWLMGWMASEEWLVGWIANSRGVIEVFLKILEDEYQASKLERSELNEWSVLSTGGPNIFLHINL